MLYGQTKDRWNWKNISYYFFIAVGFILIATYHGLNKWKAFDFDWSFKGIVTGSLTFFTLLAIAIGPIYFVSEFYRKALDKSFEYDEKGNERLIYKIFGWASILLLYLLLLFYYDNLKEVLKIWIYG